MSSTPSDISYAWSAETRAGRAVIRALENLTGRPRLIRMAMHYEREVAAGRDFWEVMQNRYRISFDMPEGALDNLPASGPALCIANHPFGILDGLAMGRLLSMRREKKDFKILANVVFRKAEELNAHVLPVSFEDSKEAVQINLETRREAQRFLERGGAIAIFPGGCVSTAPKPFGQPIDPKWKTFTAKLAARTDAAVVPIFFEGQNSRLFQIATHVSQTLRMGLLISEFGSRVGTSVGIRIGRPVAREQITAYRGDARALMEHLRQTVYALSPNPVNTLEYGWNGE